MQVGNMHYLKENDLPKEARLFPLSGALLLPGSIMPLNIFEPRYLELFDDAMANDRIVAMVQPNFLNKANTPIEDLCSVGTLGRIISIAESGDGRYLVSLGGVCRFRLKEELSAKTPYRVAKIMPFMADIEAKEFEMPEAKTELLQHLRNYVEDNNIEVDYEDIEQLQVSDLVNLLSGLLPFDLAEKQALLEADFEVRVQTLIALLEMGFSNDASDSKQTVQ
ncbi:MAG: LON peptidase substrate-binding domain-containing protein [Lentilitoribacter sp.]